jgi:MFS family permease
MKSPDHVHEVAVAEPVAERSSSTLTLVSLAHGINHAQSALKPLVFPLVLRELNFGYGELGIMLGVASAVGGLLQLGAGALGRILPRHQILGIGNASVGVCFVFVGLAQSYFQFFFWTVMSRVGGAAQHPVGSSLLSHHFKKKKLGTALATHFTAGNVGTAVIPLCAAILISLWGWRGTVILFAVPAILVGLAMSVWLKDPTARQTAHSTTTSSFWQDSGEVIANRNLRWILVAAIVAAGGSGHGIISSFLPLYLNHNLGMDATAVGVVFTLMNVGSIFGPMLGGKLADRYHATHLVRRLSRLSANDPDHPRVGRELFGRRPGRVNAGIHCIWDPSHFADAGCPYHCRRHARYRLCLVLYCDFSGRCFLVSRRWLSQRVVRTDSRFRRHGRLVRSCERLCVARSPSQDRCWRRAECHGSRSSLKAKLAMREY